MSTRTIRRYSFPLKLHVVTEIEAGRLSVAQARRRFGIAGNETVYRWLRQFGKTPHTATKVYVTMKDEQDPFEAHKAHLRALENQKQALESALAQKELQLLMAESFIKAAEAHFGCGPGFIKKNCVPKPLTKPERT